MAFPNTNIFFPTSTTLTFIDNRDLVIAWPSLNAVVTVDISSDGGESFLRALDENGQDSWDYELNAATGEARVVIRGVANLFPEGSYLVHIYDDQTNSGIIPVTRLANGLSIEALNDPETGLLTSRREMEKIFSVEGVDNHSEDWPDDDAVVYVMEQATEEVLQFLRGKFDFEDMVNSRWVRIKATYIACHLLSIRQGNHSLYAAMNDKAMLDLIDARDGVINTGMPTFVNAIVQTPMQDARFFRQGRLNPLQSTKIYGGQPLPYSVRRLVG